MAKTKKKLLVKIEYGGELMSTYLHAKLNSDIQLLKNAIDKAIASNDLAALKNILLSEYVYPEVHAKDKEGDLEYRREWDIYGEIRTYETHYVRPSIEALFFENNSYFSQVVNALIASKDEKLAEAFLDCLNETDLAGETFYAWNDQVKESIRESLVDLNAYVVILHKQVGELSEKKSDAILAVAMNIHQKIANDNLELLVNKNSSALDKLRIVSFKLTLFQDLHQYDDDLSKHRGYKRLISNALLGVSTLGIAHVGHKLIGGCWRFFNYTQSESLVAKLQKNIGLDNDEPIKFKNA